MVDNIFVYGACRTKMFYLKVGSFEMCRHVQGLNHSRYRLTRELLHSRKVVIHVLQCEFKRAGERVEINSFLVQKFQSPSSIWLRLIDAVNLDSVDTFEQSNPLTFRETDL